MRLIIVAVDYNEEVIAEPFTIPGSTETFAVHCALRADAYRSRWVATHIGTSHAVARADTIDGAIEEARATWLAATPEEIADRLALAQAEFGRRMADGRVQK